jgi:hypothetical protein
MKAKKLRPEQLYHGCDPARLPFESTESLEETSEPIGQPKAMEALCLGIGMKREGYHIFALGYPGTGRHHLVRQFLEERAPSEKVPADCCYVNNFEEQYKPRLLVLPAGKGRELSQDMEKLVGEARNALKAAF